MPTRQLGGRIALVTGAAAGIGRAISEGLAKEGATVVLADVQAARAEAAAGEIRAGGWSAEAVACDVSDARRVEATIDGIVARHGRLDILVNNAGIPGTSQPAHETAVEDFDWVIAVNLRGVFLCARYALPHLVATGNGVIVNVASTFGMVGASASPAYAASKGGVIALTRQLAVDYGPLRVRVNAVSPGYVDNDMADRRSRMSADEASANLAARETAAALQPLGRQGNTTEIAAAVVFLASDAASFMTGAIVPVDGGCTATFNSGPR